MIIGYSPGVSKGVLINTMRLSGTCLFLLIGLTEIQGKWVEGRINTKEKWAFLARFCFLSLDGQFEYLIEYDRDMGTPNLLLYYDDDSQWPAVYHSSKTCKERESVLKAEQNQVIKLSHWYPDTEYSGCIVTKANKELPASKSTSTNKPILTTNNPFLKPKYNQNSSKDDIPNDPLYYDQFLKTTTVIPNSTITQINPTTTHINLTTTQINPTTIRTNFTTWYELFPTDDSNTTTVFPDELWEHIGLDTNDENFEKLKDVEILFDYNKNNSQKIKRSTFNLHEQLHRRRLKSESSKTGQSYAKRGINNEQLVVSCHNSRRFKSARERWWFIAISNCDSASGLDVKYKFLMTNGPDGDFWHEHFSADEFYVLPVLLAYTFAYVVVMIAVVMCSVELKSRHLLHSTYKLFLVSIVMQHCGIMVQTLAYIRYAANGVGNPNAVKFGQFLCGVSEMTFLLLLVLMAKGFTITRGRLKLSFTVKLTTFMCCYMTTYIILFIYETKAFDPGEVLYLYESPAGYGLIVLRVIAWCVFAYSTYFTLKKYPEKNMFYGPFFICGTLWFYSGPLFILTANSYIDKWVRESVVTAVLLFIAFSGHIMFLMLTLPVFANKNFPYHVRTTQIGIMEVTSSNGINSFGHNVYQTTNGTPQTVIIPLTRRTEELIGNMYSYMATAPPLSLENESHKTNVVPKRTDSFRNRLVPQDSTETNTSDDIRPSIKNEEIFTVESQMSKLTESSSNNLQTEISPENVTKPLQSYDSKSLDFSKNDRTVLPENDEATKTVEINNEVGLRSDLPGVMRSRRNILEPIKREDSSVTSWSLAKGPSVVAMQRKTKSIDKCDSMDTNGVEGKKVPPVRRGLSSSGEISTIHEDHVQTYQNTVSKATMDLFSVASNKG